VLINKNLFSFRYDYRKEWLQFTHVLATSAGGSDLHEKVVTALANLVESKGGALWLERGGAFCQVACVNLPEVREHESLSGSLPSFLGRTGLVIRIDEVNIAPTLYAGLTLPPWLLAQTDAWLIISLPNGAEIIGFVVLARPRTPIDINWEVLDLLKTASQQAASYLVQFRANEALLEAEKFDAFNRMSAFVVHDLKNLIAQLALLLKNAERHRDNPEFQADMQETIEHVVERMNRLMLQLAAGATPGSMPRPIPLRELIDRVVASKREYRAGIAVESGQGLRALAHEEQLERVIGHILQNAIEATGDKGSPIKVRAYSENKYAVIEIVDAGVGMSEEFVRERLFRPFQTTKPQGMGIGMNESFQYISGIGGRITVESIENAGTCFRVFLRNAEMTRFTEAQVNA
jgi:putative PEP-CTERM system histidine kinase